MNAEEQTKIRFPQITRWFPTRKDIYFILRWNVISKSNVENFFRKEGKEAIKRKSKKTEKSRQKETHPMAFADRSH